MTADQSPLFPRTSTDQLRTILTARLPADPKWATWIDGTVEELAAAATEERTAPVDAEQYRVHGDPDLTADAEVYEVLSPDPANRDWPVRYRIDITGGLPAVLSADQPGPFIDATSRSDMFIDLVTLERLGRIAAALASRLKALS